MLPGMGGFEVVVIALLALVIVGPKDLPVLMRRLARWVNKARGLAAEFRMSFDELARQSELDELRREVDALRRGEPLAPVRAQIEPVVRDLNAGFDDPASERAYQAAVDEANGASPAEPYLPSLEPAAAPAADPYLPSFESTSPTVEVAPAAPETPQPQAAEAAPRRKARKAAAASVAEGEA